MKAKNAIRQISLPAPAKVNLFLAVTGKRLDGFHEINSVITKIDLCDQVTLEKTEQIDEVQCHCTGSHFLSGKNNLAYQAIVEWRNFTGDRTGMKVTIEKRVPSMAGLGGGSSDAVATLLALNLYHGQPFSNEELLVPAANIGSDCPFFLTDGLAHVTGRGEKIRSIVDDEKNQLNGQRIFLFQPPMGFSTHSIYQILAQQESYSDPKWAKEVVNEWEGGERSISKFLYNDFESVILNKFLFIKPLFDKLKNYFGLSFQVSGSGSCCFSFADNNLNPKEVKDLIESSLGAESRFWATRIRLN